MAEKVASNQAIGQYTNLGVGLGARAGVGGAVAGTVKEAIDSTENKCPKCMATLANGAKFCSACGERVQAQTSKVICPNCQKANEIGSKFCNECGAKL